MDEETICKKGSFESRLFAGSSKKLRPPPAHSLFFIIISFFLSFFDGQIRPELIENQAAMDLFTTACVRSLVGGRRDGLNLPTGRCQEAACLNALTDEEGNWFFSVSKCEHDAAASANGSVFSPPPFNLLTAPMTTPAAVGSRTGSGKNKIREKKINAMQSSSQFSRNILQNLKWSKGFLETRKLTHCWNGPLINMISVFRRTKRTQRPKLLTCWHCS